MMSTIKQAKRVALFVFVVSATFVQPIDVVSSRAASGTVVDEGWVPQWPVGVGIGWQGVRFRDVPEFNESISVLRARLDPQRGSWKNCTGLDVAPCNSAPTVDFSAVLQPCTSDTELDCVVEFGTIDASGKKIAATYAGVFPSVGLNDFAADPSVGLPRGGPAGLWTVSEAAGVSARTHLVRATVSGTAAPGKRVVFTNFAANASPVTLTKFPCGERPYHVVSGCRFGDFPDDPINHNGESGWSGYTDAYGWEDGFDCLLTGNLNLEEKKADCAERKAMNKDVTYYLSVRLSQAVSGWMHGRLADPLITLDEIPSASGAVAMSISGRPVSVPSIVIFKKYADLPVSLQEKYRATGGGSGGASGGGSDNVDANDPLQRNRRSNPRPSGSDGIAELEAWLPVVNDTAIADPTSWTIRTLGANNLGAAAQCVTEKNKVAGIVTTNATQYKAGAPVYDTATKSLNYTVSAPHYMSSGEVFKGAYSLIIRSDIARCIYKFTSAPITATIEVVETETGASTVVTNVSENNGWMKLTATGFTHSTPTIRVAFSQSASQPSSGSAARIDVAKGKSISSTVLVRKAGLKATARSRIWLSVAAASRRVCRLSGKTVKAVALGTCSVTVSVQTSGKTLKRALQLNVG